MKANIHSIESMGLFDGPGIRTVVFFQGCPLRCNYCHNPDTWSTNDNQLYTIDELMAEIMPYKNYYRASNGGVTLSGGEPLLQSAFIIEFAKRLKEEGIHVALDTSGIGTGEYGDLLNYIDLVLLDIKHPTKRGFFEITNRDNSQLYAFIEYLNQYDVKVWVRNVIVESINSSKEYIEKLTMFAKKIRNLEKIELLPFHKMCKEKYDELNLAFPYIDIEETTDHKITQLEDYLSEII